MACHTKDMELTENGKQLNAKLLQHIDFESKQFCKDAVEMCFLCGFVPYYIRMKNNLPCFRVLPMGTFSWAVEYVPDKESTNKDSKIDSNIDILRYKVTCLNGSLKESDIIIKNFIPPFLHPKNIFWSPLNGLLDLYILKNKQLNVALNAEEWNSKKHVAVTEKIDLKDPTTSGLQLLDDLRRYNLTGKHNNMDQRNFIRMKGKDNLTNSTTEGTFHWVNTVFSDEDGMPEARVHVMPPNTEIHEMGNLEVNSMYEYCQDKFEHCVYSLFDLPNANPTKNIPVNNSQDQQMSKQQHSNITAMSRFCEMLIGDAYSKYFKVSPTVVQCKLTPAPRLEVRGLDDFKTLQEAGIMNPQDRMRVRGMFMEK